MLGDSHWWNNLSLRWTSREMNASRGDLVVLAMVNIAGRDVRMP